MSSSAYLLFLTILFLSSLASTAFNETHTKRDISQTCYPYVGQQLLYGATFKILETTTGNYLSANVINWSNNPTAVMFNSPTQQDVFTFSTVQQYQGGHMGILQLPGTGNFDLSGGYGGILTVTSSPSFSINFIPDGNNQGGVTIKGVQTNYPSNQYSLNVFLINGQYCLSFANLNYAGVFKMYVCSGICNRYTATVNYVPDGDYHNPYIDQSAQYGGWTDGCCTRIYLPTGVDPAVACANDPNCQGYAQNSAWATLKNTNTLYSWTGFTSYVKNCSGICNSYTATVNYVPDGDYHNPDIDQSAQYGGWTDGCCTRIYLPSGVDPAVACANDPNCQGYAQNSAWATLKNTKTLYSWTGFTSYVKNC